MSEKLKSCKDLMVWQGSLLLVKRLYELTRLFPADEKFGLVFRMRRALVSVPSNVAEGHARNTTEGIQKMAGALRRSLASRP